jgi:hypothetical protein
MVESSLDVNDGVVAMDVEESTDTDPEEDDEDEDEDDDEKSESEQLGFQGVLDAIGLAALKDQDRLDVIAYLGLSGLPA